MGGGGLGSNLQSIIQPRVNTGIAQPDRLTMLTMPRQTGSQCPGRQAHNAQADRLTMPGQTGSQCPGRQAHNVQADRLTMSRQTGSQCPGRQAHNAHNAQADRPTIPVLRTEFRVALARQNHVSSISCTKDWPSHCRGNMPVQ